MTTDANETKGSVLAVDLDGTLLQSDMLHETFWNAASHDWSAAIRTIRTLKSGKAALKRDLATRASVDVTTLPYNCEVLDYIAKWRDGGGVVVLVTATDQILADQIATHLGVFDAVYGSDGDRNLKGQTKAEFLVDLYGEYGFAYVGDHAADLEVWAHAARAISVNASEALRAQVSTLGIEVEHLGTAHIDRKPYIKALRPHQWLKNILVFVPLLLAHHLDVVSFARALMAFVAFSLVASSVYVLNDLLDLNADRAHARKCKRPFAAGTVPIAHGTAMAGVLLGVGAVLSVALGPIFLFVMLSYYAMTTAYSFYFKRRAVIDVSVLSGLYTLRIIAGGVAVGVPLSMWLLAFSVFFFFALAAVKRQAELVDNINAGKVQAEGRGYRNEDAEVISQMALGTGYVSILVLALYMNSPDVALLYSNPPALWGICLILLFWISRIVLLTHRGEMHDDPIVFAVRDRISRLCGMMVVGFAVLGAVM